MHFELFHLGPLTVYTYGFLIAIGILAAFFVADRRGKAMGMDTSRLEGITLTVCITGFVCSKLLYILTRLPDIIADPGILMNLEDGWVVYGGIIGGLLGGLWYCRRHQMNFMEWFDLLIPEVALAQGFGRLGCFFAGCCYGIPVEWGITFPEGGLAPAGIPLFPSQLISSAFDFGMFFFLCWIAKRKKFNGEVGAWYLILYSVGRFIIEFFRGDLIRGAVGTLSTSQFISIFTLAAGIAILVVMRKKYKNGMTKKA
ncbi:prolipoprotein diacylglyceryl transferase [Faecalibaculum rodentium]|jgi:phosphatidylglycerol:prolipoprotein diacylglycerol transferase|uniref:Phosphatidylglycerol--prolipoprotein diacylglyceryl transferase n=4 Tax=Faecalibaculum rodentium TaxID=1702221 RepID=A0A1Q9YHV8_9FIRM|nr:prolipoprotein diacylglyceryl transferase [Faecalibaculum rodentium]OLU43783.1 prolipoprotein diacylglyceryl transferase [Faecalibaculum rodentium]